jgi:ABC-type transport system involved in Fe-S cluster assembly fused permease/ATPase subunit
MVNAIEKLPDGQHGRVAEVGLNFSAEERHLVCLARATLQKS